ncbi:MAG: hypothetical protein AAF608_13295 [Pseudomonadota bacterium]
MTMRMSQAAVRGAIGLIAALMLSACGESVSQDDAGAPPAEALPEDALGTAAPEELKTAQCVLWPGEYRGDCLFEPRGRGSFAVTRDDGKPFYDDVLEVVVMIYAQGEANVRSRLASGTTAEWGDAMRSESYPACWIGTDFSVCAY